MADYTIYCNTSYCFSQKLCVWGCVIELPSGKSQNYSGCYQNVSDPSFGELKAIIKAIGKVKAHVSPCLTIFCDSLDLVEKFAATTKLKHAQKLGGDWVALFNYKLQFRMTIEYIEQEKNPACAIVEAELDRCKEAIRLKTASASESYSN